MPEPYRRLDTAVLEALLLTGPLGLSEHDISELHGFGYARSAQAGIDIVTSGEYDLGFFLRPTPVTQVREVAAEGVSMPPKSTYFFPKVITGMLFNPLDAALTRANIEGTMRASAQRVQDFRHIVKVRDHRMPVDEPSETRRRRHRAQPAGAPRREPRHPAPP